MTAHCLLSAPLRPLRRGGRFLSSPRWCAAVLLTSPGPGASQGGDDSHTVTVGRLSAQALFNVVFFFLTRKQYFFNKVFIPNSPLHSPDFVTYSSLLERCPPYLQAMTGRGSQVSGLAQDPVPGRAFHPSRASQPSCRHRPNVIPATT